MKTKTATKTEALPLKEAFIVVLFISLILGLVQLGYYVGLIKDFEW